MNDQEIRKAGLKVTMPRVKILQLLESSEQRHVSAEDLYRMLLESGDEIGLATIYRVLTQFEAAGLVQKHNFEGGYSVFELERGEHHDHLICVRCARVVEFVDPMIEQRQQDLAGERGFSVAEHSLTIYGRCKNPDCKHAKQS